MKKRNLIMEKWTIVGYYPHLRLPYGCYVGAENAREAVESCLKNIRKNWPKERQVIIVNTVSALGTLHGFGGLLSSERGVTIKTALEPESAVSLRIKSQAGARLKRLMKRGLTPLGA